MSKKKDVVRLPLIPLRGAVVFPNTVVTLDVVRERSIAALHRAMEDNGELVLAAQRDATTEHPGREDLYDIGTVAHIKQLMPMPDEGVRMLVEGIGRASLENLLDEGVLQVGVVAPFGDAMSETNPERLAKMHVLTIMAQRILNVRSMAMPEMMQQLQGAIEPDVFCDVCANGLLRQVEDRQNVLSQDSVDDRLDMLVDLLATELSLGELEERIQQRVREAMERSNHEYYLREQIRAIQDELGEDEDEEVAELRRRLNESKMPDEAREKVTKELRRLARTSVQAPESSVSQNYIEYMLDLPWGVRREGKIDLKYARKVLEEDHYGLEEVKERLIEFLAVKSVASQMKSPILCLVGPPGVGKTSIARSVARALKRDFTQMSLGGVHDEAEIRGHRKTYVGAMPGRIIASIEQCKSVDPVFLLDEIDKMAHDFRGDPASAMLEVLDPEQNKAFRDHYLEAPFDLSNVLFITTANTTATIDRALLDRMEVIEVPSYTLEEKLQIAKRHLLPKQMEAHGLKRGRLRMTDKALRSVIDGYTRESGVRNLERQIAKICRKATVRFVDQPDLANISLKPADLREWLGAPLFQRQDTEKKATVGIVNGLAWTQVGGEVMPVEAMTFEGKGAIEMTGSLGDVMKESARIARSIVRARLEQYGVAPDFFDVHDLHIHVPEGAVPKDGPSAGAALTCALMSAVSGRPAASDIAMTGEVTLHGKVLPIGGVKEKLLAAYRMGIVKILLPHDNEADLEKIEAEVRDRLSIELISTVDEALKKVLVEPEDAK